jgi:hypothetical protein
VLNIMASSKSSDELTLASTDHNLDRAHDHSSKSYMHNVMRRALTMSIFHH